MKSVTAVRLTGWSLALGLTACGGGGGGGGSSGGTTAAVNPVTGFSVPSEISPVSTGGGGNKAGFAKSLQALSYAAADPDTDYSKARTVRFVDEHAIDQFDIIETILNALSQTNYSDSANVNQGPYKAIVSWQENNDGRDTKQLETWVVDSAMIQENGQDVNRVQAWIEEEGRIIKAQFKIYASATKRADGSYQDYGVWDLVAKFNDAGTLFFAAQARIGQNGETVLAINAHMDNHEGGFEDIQAVMHKSDTSGYGKVLFPEWTNNAMTQAQASYVYNAAQLRVQKGNADVYKDRAAMVDMTHRYGMFDAATGADVMKSKSFGFPVNYTAVDPNTQQNVNRFGWYGAWQGRHQLWSGQNGTVADGTVVTRQDRGGNATPETYTTVSLTGTLTRRTLVAADLNDLLNLPVETWVGFHHDLVYSAAQGQWLEQGQPYTAWNDLVLQPRKMVNISRWDNVQQKPIDYLYDPAGAGGAGLYLATRDPNTGQLVNSGQLYVPADNDMLWININGSIYIEYKGAQTGWVQKKLVSFDERNWTPAFDPNGDTAYAPELNRQYYLNTQGINYVVTRTAAGPDVYDVKIEIQSAANPVNTAALLNAGGTAIASFRVQWFNPNDPNRTSTYQFVTDPANAKFLKLVYLTVGTDDANTTPAPQAGDVVTRGVWGLVGYDALNVSTGVQFNWEFPQQGDNWGTQTYLYTLDGSNNRVYKLLDDPIRLASITVTVNGAPKTLSMQFDGWMHGLPDLFQELEKSGWLMTATIAAKIVSLPEGTQVTDAVDANKSYLLKPLEIGQYLQVSAVPDATLDITAANAIDLTNAQTLPQFVDHQMGAVPATTGTKYSEGQLVQ